MGRAGSGARGEAGAPGWSSERTDAAELAQGHGGLRGQVGTPEVGGSPAWGTRMTSEGPLPLCKKVSAVWRRSGREARPLGARAGRGHLRWTRVRAGPARAAGRPGLSDTRLRRPSAPAAGAGSPGSRSAVGPSGPGPLGRAPCAQRSGEGRGGCQWSWSVSRWTQSVGQRFL